MSNNRFLQSNLTSTDLASETTLKNVCSKLEGELDVNIVGGAGGNVVISDVNFTTTQTEDLNVSIQSPLNGGGSSISCQVDANTAIDLNTGAITTKTQRMTMATDQPAISMDIYGINTTHNRHYRLRTADPQLLFRSNFGIDEEPNVWKYTLNSGAGISEAFNSQKRYVSLDTTANTSGSFEMQTKLRYDVNAGMTSVFITLVPRLTNGGGGSATDIIRIGIYDTNANPHGMAMEIIGDDTYKTVVFQGITAIKTVNSGWSINTNIQGSRGDTQTYVFEFSNDINRWGYVYRGNIIYVHERHSDVVNISSYGFLPLTVEMECTNPNPAWSTSIVGCKIMQESSVQPILNPQRYSANNSAVINNASANIGYVGIRYSTILSNSENKRVRVVSMSYSPNGGTEDWILRIYRNSTFNGALSWNTQPNSAVQYLNGVAANTILVAGIPEYTTVHSNRGGMGNEIIRFEPPIDLANDDTLVVCIQGFTTQNGIASINWIEG